jgi:hypothetical protein
VHTAEVRVHFAALMVSLTKAAMFDAAEALWEWGDEWLDYTDEDREQLEEELDLT